MSSGPGVSSPFSTRPGCTLCSMVTSPFPRNDALDASLNGGAGAGIGGSSNASGGNRPSSMYAPWRRDSDQSSVHSGLGANSSTTALPTAHSSGTNVIIHRDANVTAYIEKKYPVSSKGHVIVVLNLHVPNIYSLSANDLPLLNHIQQTATHLLHSLNPVPIPSSPTPGPRTNAEEALANRIPLAPSPESQDPPFHIGFITPPFRDSKIPITDHLHCHAYVGTADLAGWWRGVAYSGLAWYPIQDLIAEIRETVSNNRVKSGYTNRPSAPIDLVPSAGAISGGADGSAEQFLPLPLQANKAHASPAPTGVGLGSSQTSLLGSGSGESSGVNLRAGVPSLMISTTGADSFEQSQGGSGNLLGSGGGVVAGGGGSVDLSSFRRTTGDEYGYEPEPPELDLNTPTAAVSSMSREHRPRESFDDAGWEGMDGSVSGSGGEEGQAGPGPRSIQAISNAGR